MLVYIWVEKVRSLWMSASPLLRILTSCLKRIFGVSAIWAVAPAATTSATTNATPRIILLLIRVPFPWRL